MTDEKTEDKKAAPEKAPEPVDQIVQTQHTTRINGVEIAYTVTTGTIVLKEESVKRKRARPRAKKPGRPSSSSPTPATASTTRRSAR